jgi:hypothetical protein
MVSHDAVIECRAIGHGPNPHGISQVRIRVDGRTRLLDLVANQMHFPLPGETGTFVYRDRHTGVVWKVVDFRVPAPTLIAPQIAWGLGGNGD